MSTFLEEEKRASFEGISNGSSKRRLAIATWEKSASRVNNCVGNRWVGGWKLLRRVGRVRMAT
jgi:hypothetical protein